MNHRWSEHFEEHKKLIKSELKQNITVMNMDTFSFVNMDKQNARMQEPSPERKK